MSIYKEIEVTRKRLDVCINVTYGSDLLPIELKVTDFKIPSGAMAVAYANYGANLKKIICDIENNTIIFTLQEGFFEVGKNELQLRVVHNEKSLFSFMCTVVCHESFSDDDAKEVKEQPTLVEQLIERLRRHTYNQVFAGKVVEDSGKFYLASYSSAEGKPLENDLIINTDGEMYLVVDVSEKDTTVESVGVSLKGPKGNAFVYENFTKEQLDFLADDVTNKLIQKGIAVDGKSTSHLITKNDYIDALVNTGLYYSNNSEDIYYLLEGCGFIRPEVVKENDWFPMLLLVEVYGGVSQNLEGGGQPCQNLRVYFYQDKNDNSQMFEYDRVRNNIGIWNPWKENTLSYELKAPFFASYGETSYQDVLNAYNDGRPCYCKEGDGIHITQLISCGGIQGAVFSYFDAASKTATYYKISQTSVWTKGQESYDKTDEITEKSSNNQIPTAKAVYNCVDKLSQEKADKNDVITNTNNIAGLQKTMDDILSVKAQGDALEEQLVWLAENGDTTKEYLCADGYYYEFVYTEGEPLYKNLLPLATDMDRKTIFNGKGYIEAHRTKSDGSIASCAGMMTTGFIPCKYGDVIRIKNTVDSTTTYTQSLTFYDSNNTYLKHLGTPTVNTSPLASGITMSDDKSEITIDTSQITIASNIQNCDSFRLSRGDLSNGIITVNQEIIEGTTEGTYEWRKTERTNSNTNYENRIADIEEEVEDIRVRLNNIGENDNKQEIFNTNFKVISHRGYMNVAPENTLSAFKLAKKMGFEYVECDIAQTSDGVAVLLHDDTVDRTSNGTGSISTLTFAEVRALDFGSWKSSEYTGEKIPTFEEFLLLCKNIGLKAYIEIKGTATFNQTQFEALVATVKRCGMRENVTWIGSVQAHLTHIHNADSKARLGLVRSGISDNTIATVTELRNAGINDLFIDINASQATEENLERAINADVPVEVYADDSIDIGSLSPYITGYTVDSTKVVETLYNKYI